jgi:CubicO group peptidase (beta-lactamase class C family)
MKKLLIILSIILILGFAIYIKSTTDNMLDKTIKYEFPTGTLEEVGIQEKSLTLINNIIEADIENGFPGAQLAVIKDGKLVYQNAWGYTNRYSGDGTKLENPTKVTNETLFDLASNTKMYSVAYAIQYLTENNKLSLDNKVVDIMGNEFVDNTIEIPFSSWGEKYPGLEQIKEWKSQITIKDLMMHRAGLPDSGHYHNQKYDQINQKLVDDVDNLLYVASSSKLTTYEEAICKTPLIYEPRSKVMYSDIDYMLLGLIVEEVSGLDLNSFLKETFWDPMDLTHITYTPIFHRFSKEDCAATELQGNTRSGLVDFPNVRTYTIQGEVHDEESYYTMEAMSGHAGLFANATDLAKLASVMLDGTYGDIRFFSGDTIKLFTSQQEDDLPNYGIGWWRNGNQKRSYYFGEQAPETNIGHQGWTGTLTMIDYENNMVVVFLTNSKNTPIWNPISLDNANDFEGNYFTSCSLGFVPEIIYYGINYSGDELDTKLNEYMQILINKKALQNKNEEKELNEKLPENHPRVRAKKALEKAKESI